MATHGRRFSEIWPVLPVDIFGKSRLCVETWNRPCTCDSSPKPGTKVTSIGHSIKLVPHVSPLVLAGHATLSRHEAVVNLGTSEST